VRPSLHVRLSRHVRPSRQRRLSRQVLPSTAELA
jgi:hypothetical protein